MNAKRRQGIVPPPCRLSGLIQFAPFRSFVSCFRRLSHGSVYQNIFMNPSQYFSISFDIDTTASQIKVIKLASQLTDGQLYFSISHLAVGQFASLKKMDQKEACSLYNYYKTTLSNLFIFQNLFEDLQFHTMNRVKM